MDEKRIERLASLLRDSECWEHPGWVYGNEPHHQRDTIDAVIGYGPGDNITAHAHWHALAAAIKEVESGAVMGSETQCAVCGEAPASTAEWRGIYLCTGGNPSHKQCCEACRAVRPHPGFDKFDGDDRIRRVLQSRKLYRAEKAKGKAAPIRWVVMGEWSTTKAREAVVADRMTHTEGGELRFALEPKAWDGFLTWIFCNQSLAQRDGRSLAHFKRYTPCATFDGCVVVPRYGKSPRYPGPNAPSRHDADGYLAREWNHAHPMRCKDCGGPAVAHRCTPRVTGPVLGTVRISQLEQRVGALEAKASEPYRVVFSDGKSAIGMVKALENRTASLEADRATLCQVCDCLMRLEAKGFGKWPVGEHEIKRIVEDGTARILAALESAANVKRGVGSDKRKARRAK